MARKYGRGPLVEALCEFRFSPDSPWDLTIPGLVYERVREPFSEKRQARVIEANLAASAKCLEQRLTSSERMQFFQPDQAALVQVGEHLLVVNHLQPYPGWDAFLPLIRQGFQAYTEVTGAAQIERIGLRYINRIEIQERPLEIEEFLEFRPHMGVALPATVGSFMVGIEIPFESDQGTLRLQLASQPEAKPQVSTFLLDLDYFTSKPGCVALDDVFGWLDRAHGHVEQTFEACLTQRLRRLFEEIGA